MLSECLAGCSSCGQLAKGAVLCASVKTHTLEEKKKIQRQGPHDLNGMGGAVDFQLLPILPSALPRLLEPLSALGILGIERLGAGLRLRRGVMCPHGLPQCLG